MKKMILTAAAIVLVIASALFMIPVMESESTQSEVFSRVGIAGDGE